MKKKGSALVLTVLILAFFTVISMNIYYIGQKKAESAGDKTTGEEITNDIDIASSIIYQEAYLAENFVRLGVVYDPNHPVSLDEDDGTYTSDTKLYSEPSEDTAYLYYDSGSSEWAYNKTYYGIQLNDISEYFDSYWDYEKEDKDSQKAIISEEVEGGEVKSRIWQSGGVPSKITKLWDDDSLFSVGGYKLESETNDGTEKTAVFKKTVKIVGDDNKEDDNIYIPSMTFIITATETVNVEDGEYYGAVVNLEIEKQ
jgi:archaellin